MLQLKIKILKLSSFLSLRKQYQVLKCNISASLYLFVALTLYLGITLFVDISLAFFWGISLFAYYTM